MDKRKLMTMHTVLYQKDDIKRPKCQEKKEEENSPLLRIA